MRVSFLTPYFGRLPKYFPLFVQSAARNTGATFLIVTDEEIPLQLPDNFRHVRLTRADVESRVREKLSPDFRLAYGYKVVDVRPFYGLVFEDLLSGSDFWGYCDADIVLGDISPVLQPEYLNKFDFFCADAGPVISTFCLYRNEERYNRMALKIPDYARKLNSQEYESVDEREMGKLIDAATDVRRVRPANLRQSQLSISEQGRMVGRTLGVAGDPTEFYWSDGRTFVRSRGSEPQECLYLHFIGLKRSYHWADYDPAREYKEFAFSAAGFQPWRTPPAGLAAVRQVTRAAAMRALGSTRSQIARRLSTTARHKIKSWLPV